MTGSLVFVFVGAVVGAYWQGAAYLGLFLVMVCFCLLLTSYRVWQDEKRRRLNQVAAVDREWRARFGELFKELRHVEGKAGREQDSLFARVKELEAVMAAAPPVTSLP